MGSKGVFERYLGSLQAAPLLGFCLPLTWLFIPLILGTDFSIIFHFCGGCTLLLIALMAHFHKLPKRIGSLTWIATLLLSLAPIYLLLPISVFHAGLVVCAIASGMSHAFVFAVWFDYYCRQTTKIAANYTLAAFALSGLIRFVLVAIPITPQGVLLLILSIMPICAQLILSFSKGVQKNEITLCLTTESSGSEDSKPKSFGPSGFLITVILGGIVLGIMQNGMPNWPDEHISQYIGYALRFLIPILLLIWVNAVFQNEHYENWFRIIVAFLAICLAIPLFFNSYISSIIPSFVLVTRNLIGVFVYLMLFSIVRDYDVHLLAIFGIARGFYYFAHSFGLFLSSHTHLTELLTALGDSVFYFLMTCVLILFISNYSSVITRILNIDLRKDISSLTASTDEKCKDIALRYKLTGREQEVLRLLLLGRTKHYIAQTLYLSEDTIRWHTKRIYNKLNVHSRQELMTLAGID